MHLHIVNYRGFQAHAVTPFLRVAGLFILFDDEVAADVSDLTCFGAVRFVREDEDGYLPADSNVGTGITVTDVSDDGQTILTRI
jgi:hypothetical protein